VGKRRCGEVESLKEMGRRAARFIDQRGGEHAAHTDARGEVAAAGCESCTAVVRAAVRAAELNSGRSRCRYQLLLLSWFRQRLAHAVPHDLTPKVLENHLNGKRGSARFERPRDAPRFRAIAWHRCACLYCSRPSSGVHRPLCKRFASFIIRLLDVLLSPHVIRAFDCLGENERESR